MPNILDEKLIEELRRRAKEENFIRANMWITMANNCELGLRNLMFTLATFLFTFTSPIFLDPKLLSSNEKLMFILSWIFLLCSIVSGIIHFIISIRYYVNVARENNLQEGIFSGSVPWRSILEYQSAVDKVTEISKHKELETNQLTLGIQVLLVFIGFLFVLSAGISILY